jgi:hypothetical protein
MVRPRQRCSNGILTRFAGRQQMNNALDVRRGDIPPCRRGLGEPRGHVHNCPLVSPVL